MKERPIIMTAESVRAILDGRKTQTRRVIVPQPDGISNDGRAYVYKTITVVRAKSLEVISHPDGHPEQRFINILKSPYGVPGDRLWVKETFGIDPNDYGYPDDQQGMFVSYKADFPSDYKFYWGWSPSLYMPRRFSRITLEITGVRVERVQDITYLDAIAEGVDRDWPEKNYHLLWDRLNAKRGYPWADNPWAWVLEFRKI